MEDRVTVSDAIVSELERARVDTLFGIVSIHNLPIYDAVARHGGFRIIKPRGESGALNMADAYGRIGGRLGVAITSTLRPPAYIPSLVCHDLRSVNWPDWLKLRGPKSSGFMPTAVVGFWIRRIGEVSLVSWF